MKNKNNLKTESVTRTPLQVDFSGAKVIIRGRKVTGMTYTELRVLHRLSAGGIVSRGALLAAGWSGTNLPLKTALVRLRMVLSRIRGKLGRVGVKVVCVPGEGYHL